MTFVLDSSALLRFTDKESGFDRVRALLHNASCGESTLLISAVNWGEIVNVACKKLGVSQARRLLDSLANLPLSVVPADREGAERAGMFKFDFNVGYADAFAGALAVREKATLVTADFDFKSVPKNLLKIEFLPLK